MRILIPHIPERINLKDVPAVETKPEDKSEEASENEGNLTPPADVEPGKPESFIIFSP